MATIWKELLFLHGHFARPQDVLDEIAQRTAVAATPGEMPLSTDAAARLPVSVPREAVPRSAAAIDADGLACGGCR